MDTVPMLTDQQRRVARLAAECATNKQIAATLQISERQVEQHLTHIVDRWCLDRSKNLRAQIVTRYWQTFGYPRIPA